MKQEMLCPPNLTLECLSVSPIYLAFQLWHLYEYIILDTKSLGMGILKQNVCEILLWGLKVKFSETFSIVR